MSSASDSKHIAGGGGSVRVDKWLWMVRVFKTRTAATSACTSGRVRVNDEAVKPATKIVPGDIVESRRGEDQIVYRVLGVPVSRVGAKLLPDLVEDLSPPSQRRHSGSERYEVPHGARERGQGRPTKKDRRAIDRLRGRDK